MKFIWNWRKALLELVKLAAALIAGAAGGSI